MSDPRPTTFNGLFAFGALVLGLGVLWGALSSHLRGPTPEKELAVAEGAAIEVEESLSRKYGSVSFRVGSYHLSYGNDRPKYQEVLAAVKDDLPVRIWVRTRKTWTGDETMLYQMKVFDRTVLPYDEAVTKDAEGTLLATFGGVVLAGFGAFATYSYVRSPGPRRAAGEPASPDEAGAENREFVVWGISVLLYALVVVGPLTDYGHAALVGAVGQRPAGQPAVVTYLILVTLAYLPVPWFVWGAVYLSDRVAREGRMSALWAAGITGEIDLHLRRARITVGLGLAYLLLVATGWVAYTAFLAS